MGCGCGSSASTEKFTVQTADGITKKFNTRPEAEAYAIQNGGGMVKRA